MATQECQLRGHQLSPITVVVCLPHTPCMLHRCSRAGCVRSRHSVVQHQQLLLGCGIALT